jgi:quinol monooxygenase YgiN
MYGLIGIFTALPGRREDLLAAMTENREQMPGCLSYIIARDPANADALWITEVWDTKESHEASIQIPWVQAAIEKAMPLIVGMEQVAETEPVGGHGLVAS